MLLGKFSGILVGKWILGEMDFEKVGFSESEIWGKFDLGKEGFGESGIMGKRNFRKEGFVDCEMWQFWDSGV